VLLLGFRRSDNGDGSLPIRGDVEIASRKLRVRNAEQLSGGAGTKLGLGG
jgi:hypothetical protein